MEDIKIGSNLKKIRTAKGLRQKDVADRLGISAAAYRKYECDANSPTLTTLAKIAEALHVCIADILHPSQSVTDQTETRLLTHFNKLSEAGKETATDLVKVLSIHDY